MKFGLMSYDYTTNLGNEVQSIAARRFLPQIDYFIEHEQLNLFRSNEKVKMIMNGWYLDCLNSWPPSKSINPLLISMHFTTSINDTKMIISSSESKDFFSSYGPVGCRDYATLNLLNDLDIDAYYSGCLTLTLNSNNKKTDYKYIVVNSWNSKKLIDFLKTKSDLPIYDIHQESIHSLDQKYLGIIPSYYTSFYNHNEKFFIAENMLKLYENAHCVITDRVHCALPCLAFKTPVLFFNSASFAPERLKGINDLVLESTFEDYKKNYNMFDVENPPNNSKKYLKIRNDLIKKTKRFTGYVSDSYELGWTNDKIIYEQTYLLTNTARASRSYMQGVIDLTKKYESKIENQDQVISDQNRVISDQNRVISNQDQVISNQNQVINEMQKSNSWKLTKPLRKFTNVIKNLKK
jgi:hypothetical protein